MEDKLKGLLIEDNPKDTRLIREMLAEVRDAPFDLECTERLSTGLERLAAGGIDVVLLDLSLPDSRGLDTFTKVHARTPQVPIIVLTGLDDEALAVEAVREGAQDYLVKGQVDSHLLVRAMRYAIERKQVVEEETKRRNEELAALNAIAATVSQSLDLKEVLEAALEKTLAVLNVEGGVIYRFNETNQTFAPAVHRGISQDVLREVTGFKMGEGLSGHVAESGEPLVLADLGADPRDISLAFSREGWHSYAGVPIKCKGKVVGVMTLGTRQKGHFRLDHATLLNHVGNQIGVAIENARLYQNERRRAAQLAVVNQVARRAASILDMGQLLQEVVTAIQQSFNYYHVGLFLLHEASGELEMRAIAGGFASVAPPGHRLAWEEGMANWTAKTGQLLLANDVSQEPRYVRGRLKETLTKAELCVPLKLADKVIGVLDIQSTQLNAFNEMDLMAMETLADQLAVAIENARLYQETMRRLEETKTLGAVTTTLTRSLDLDQVLRSIVDFATRLIPASTSGVILLVDEAAGKLIPWATSTPGVNVEENMGISIGEGIAGLVVREKRLINVPNVEEDPRFLTTDTAISKKSLLTVPLMIDGDCIGALSLDSDQAGAFNADDERLLTTLAAQAAVAVRNAWLHQEVQRRLEELILLDQVGRTATSSLDLGKILTTVMEETALVLGTEAGSILLLDEESSELVFEAAVGPRSEAMKGLRLPLGQGISGWVAREGQPLLVPDVRDDPRFYSGIDEATGFVTRSVLAVPMKVKGKVIGVIEAVNQTGGDFGQVDVELLSSMAQWAAIAIENARLYETAQGELAERRRVEEEIRQRNQELATLNAIAITLNQPLDLETMLCGALDKVLEVIEIDASCIHLLDEDAGMLSLVAQRGFSQEMVEESKTIRLGESLTGKVAQSGQSIVVDRVSKAPRLSMRTGRREALHAFAGFPIKSKDKVLGVLGVFSRSPQQLSAQDVDLLTAIGHQVGVAIENVRLAEEASEIEILRELNRLRSELIANVSHELRTPLGLIKIFSTTLLREDADFDRETQWEFLHGIEEETDKLEKIVDNLLDLSRMKDGRLRLDKRPTDVGQLAREVMEAMEVQLMQHHFVHDFPSEPLVATVDPKRIEQVLRNLLSNAIKYSPEGGTITVQGRKDERQLLVQVSDQGIGIPSEDLERVFERFYRVENEITQAVRGAGLGLPVCRGIVEAHGGRIWVESTLGVGSTFYFTMPVGAKSESHQPSAVRLKLKADR